MQEPRPNYASMDSSQAARRAADAWFEQINPKPAPPALEIAERANLVKLDRGHIWIEASHEWQSIKLKLFVRSGESVWEKEISAEELAVLSEEIAKALSNVGILEQNATAGIAYRRLVDEWESQQRDARWKAEREWEKANIRDDSAEEEYDDDDEEDDDES